MYTQYYHVYKELPTAVARFGVCRLVAARFGYSYVVVAGRTEYVELRVREDLVASFVECLADDLSATQRAALLDRLADDGDDGVEDESAEN